MLLKIKNGQLSKKLFLFQNKTIFCEILLKILWKNNFIIGYKISNYKFKIFLKYFNYKPAIYYLKIIPNSNNYNYFLSVKQIWKLNVSNSFCVISTNKGLKSLTDCKKLNIGGKLLFLVK